MCLLLHTVCSAWSSSTLTFFSSGPPSPDPVPSPVPVDDKISETHDQQIMKRIREEYIPALQHEGM